MSDKKNITVTDLDLEHHSGDAGFHAKFDCPECGESVHVAQYPWWSTKCKCGEWTLDINAFLNK